MRQAKTFSEASHIFTEHELNMTSQQDCFMANTKKKAKHQKLQKEKHYRWYAVIRDECRCT